MGWGVARLVAARRCEGRSDPEPTQGLQRVGRLRTVPQERCSVGREPGGRVTNHPAFIRATCPEAGRSPITGVRSVRGSSPDRAPGASRLHGAPRARAIDGPGLRADRPLVSPAGDLDGEAAVAERGDNQPAARVRRIRLRVAPSTERHEAVEIEVRAPLGALHNVVDLEPGACAARLTDPPGAGENLRADPAPGLQVCRRSTAGEGTTRPDAAPRGLTDTDPGSDSPGALHASQTEVCPRGQTGEFDTEEDAGGRVAACNSHSGRHSRQPARKIAIGFGEPTTRFPR
jgi:hypothetical protein